MKKIYISCFLLFIMLKGFSQDEQLVPLNSNAKLEFNQKKGNLTNVGQRQNALLSNWQVIFIIASSWSRRLFNGSTPCSWRFNRRQFGIYQFFLPTNGFGSKTRSWKRLFKTRISKSICTVGRKMECNRR